MPPPPPSLLAQADVAEGVNVIELYEACSEAPGVVCRWVFEQTESVGLAEVADWIVGALLPVIIVFCAAWVINRVVRRAIRRFAGRIEGAAESGRLARWKQRTPAMLLATGEVNIRSAARAQTVAAVLRSAATGVIWTFAFIYALGALGVNLGPLLAGAGVAGVALGFGAQSMVRDFLAGTFMLIEDQFGVGDVIDLGEATGTVEQVSLRVTRVRDINGTVWHVPNGEIRRVGNMSQQWARAVIDVAVAPTADIAKAIRILERTSADVWESDEARPDVLDRAEVLGVNDVGPEAAIIRVQGRTRPGAQWRVSRLWRAKLIEALVSGGIELPPSTLIRYGRRTES